MGHGGSRQHGVSTCCINRAGLDDEEYTSLRNALQVGEDTPQARVSLPAFLARFPAHLRPLVQPLFFQLARVPSTSAATGAQANVTRSQSGVRSSFGTSSPSGSRRSSKPKRGPDSPTNADVEPSLVEPAVPWSVFVAGISELLKNGATWPALLTAWVGEEGSSADPSLVSRCEAGTELAAALCFWSAHPSFVPGPGAPGGVPTSAAAAVAAGDTAPAPLDTVLSVLRPCAAGAVAAAGKDGAAAAVSEAVAARLASDVPCLTRGVGPRLRQALLEAPPSPDCPRLESRMLDAGLSFILRGLCAKLWESGPWDALFRDWCDGRSFNGLLKGTLHYQGIALLLICGTSGEVLGAVSDCWEEGNGKYGGGSECLLFALLPELKVFRSTGRSENFGYLNSRNKHAPRGLGFGGQVGCFRLWINADFDECQVLESDATYQNGRLLPGSDYQISFKISHLEVWGCAGVEAREAQRAGQARSEVFRNQARQVDRARMAENEFDKEILLGKTFGRNSEGTERAQT